MLKDFYSNDYEGFFDIDLRDASDRMKKTAYAYFKMVSFLSEIDSITSDLLDSNTFQFARVLRPGKGEDAKEAYERLAKNESVAKLLKDVNIGKDLTHEEEPEFKEWYDNCDLLINLLCTFFNNNFHTKPTSKHHLDLYIDVGKLLARFFKRDTAMQRRYAVNFLKNFDQATSDTPE